MLFLLLSGVSFATTPIEIIFVQKSSVEKNIVIIDGEVQGKTVQLTCFVTAQNCREIPEGVYSFIRVAPGKGIYTDCPNIDIYVKDLNNKKAAQVAEYCLLGN